MNRRSLAAVRHGLLLATAAAVLAGVFTLYLRPDFMVDLAQQLWACF